MANSIEGGPISGRAYNRHNFFSLAERWAFNPNGLISDSLWYIGLFHEEKKETTPSCYIWPFRNRMGRFHEFEKDDQTCS